MTHTNRRETTQETVRRLAAQLRQLEQSRRPSPERPAARPTGVDVLDALLPEGGLPNGCLTEWLTDAPGSGAETLVFRLLAAWLSPDERLVVLDPDGEFHAPAAALLGVNLAQTLVVHGPHRGDLLWALEQSLRCVGVTAVVGWLGRERSSQALRRLKLAAETGRAVGFLFRPAACREEPPWGDVRCLVRPQPSARDPSDLSSGRRLLVELLYGRGCASGGLVELEICDETGDVRAVPRVALATGAPRATGS